MGVKKVKDCIAPFTFSELKKVSVEMFGLVTVPENTYPFCQSACNVCNS